MGRKWYEKASQLQMLALSHGWPETWTKVTWRAEPRAQRDGHREERNRNWRQGPGGKAEQPWTRVSHPVAGLYGCGLQPFWHREPVVWRTEGHTERHRSPPLRWPLPIVGRGQGDRRWNSSEDGGRVGVPCFKVAVPSCCALGRYWADT